MRLVTFVQDDAAPCVGITDGVGIALLPAGFEAITDMIGVITLWERIAPALSAIDRFPIPLRSVRLCAPVLRPGKIFALGLNYADHVSESGREPPDYQMWFTKAVTSINGPHDPIERPRASTKLDYEGELVYVIGKRCRHVAEERAHEVIFGYAVGNDVSVRDWQTRTTQHTLGKSFDTHAPYGPWIVTADAVDPADLAIRTLVNGDLRQDSRTSQLIFSCAAQVAYLSQAMTLEPGDIVFTGTPSGVGAARKPPLWLIPGDRVRVEIEQIGAIENVVEDECSPLNAR